MAREVLTTISRELGRSPQIVGVAWVAILLVLVVAPVALTLARESRFVASVEVTSGDAQLSPAALAASLPAAVKPSKDTEETPDAPADPITPQEARVIADEATVADRVTATPIARGAVVSVWGSTPAEAARLGDALAMKLEQDAAQAGTGRVILGARHIPTVTRPIDRVVDALPGPFPGRPHPLWAGFTGLLVAVTLRAALLLSGSDLMRRSPTERVPGTRRARPIT
ncbi:MAG: hypothetical protein ACRDKS_07645 [Actinomycetota bacterium]